jgi:hypothetical protein
MLLFSKFSPDRKRGENLADRVGLKKEKKRLFLHYMSVPACLPGRQQPAGEGTGSTYGGSSRLVREPDQLMAAATGW